MTTFNGYKMIPMRDGRSLAKVECPACHPINYFAMWSWAGNGACRCKNCRVKIRYLTGEVVIPE